MISIYNKSSYKELRQKLRNQSTRAEKMLWEKLKGKKLNGLKFRRQYGIDRYVVDFYCPQLRLAIEVDGGVHLSDEQKDYDRQRQKYIESHNIQFLRFANLQVYENLEEVLQIIAVKTHSMLLSK